MLTILGTLLDDAVVRSFPPGGTILYQGEVPRSVCIILDGSVRVFSISATGEEQITTHHIAGEVFPTSWMFGKSKAAMFFYEALSDCRIAFVPRTDFMDYIHTNEVASKAMLDYFAATYAAMLLRVNALEQPKARQKLSNTLFYLCQRYGKETGGGVVRIPIPFTHQDLASLVGLTRETTATEMSKLKTEKILTYKNQIYQVNVNKLLEIVGEESFRGVSIA